MKFSGLRATVAALGVAALTATTLGVSATSAAAHGGVTHLAPRTHFTMKADGSSGLTQGGEGIPNIDSVRSTIRRYYNATAGIADKTSSPYISELKRIESRQLSELARSLRAHRGQGHARHHGRGHDQGHARHHGRRHHQGHSHEGKPAIVFDADDTTLWTYDMEDAAMGFSFDPTLQDTWVQDARFPATPGMVDLVTRAKRMGYAVFGLTGRNDGQKAATLRNLTKVGYGHTFTDKNFFTKWTGTGASRQPSYISCATAKCTTVEYKAGTRKHIESMGYDIVLNVGDQWSDLQGGYADRTLKLPNPTYFLPSPDLDGTPADARFSPRTHFTMAPDGSSGATQGGEGIPNIDIDKSTIRTYYSATDGISDKTSSPYISELARLERARTAELTRTCAAAARHGQKPAIVFDADDTTLWTYDMEDAAMHFNFSPSVQNDEWVQPQRFPATPGMPALVQAVKDSGCAVVGITGRNHDQKSATLGNLAKFYGDAFTSDLYFTKWTGSGSSRQPGYVTCAAAKCTTIEYKSQTRRHVERDLGYDIVANFGDQFSDLIGGYADEPVKLPNPTYYLP